MPSSPVPVGKWTRTERTVGVNLAFLPAPNSLEASRLAQRNRQLTLRSNAMDSAQITSHCGSVVATFYIIADKGKFFRFPSNRVASHKV